MKKCETVKTSHDGNWLLVFEDGFYKFVCLKNNLHYCSPSGSVLKVPSKSLATALFSQLESVDSISVDNIYPDIVIGFPVSIALLTGRNYYHYTDGIRDDVQPLSFKPVDLLSYTYNDTFDSYNQSNTLFKYLPRSCWIKRINAHINGFEVYHLIVLTIDNNNKISNAMVLEEYLCDDENDYSMYPGMVICDMDEYYLTKSIPNAVIKELDMLLSGRYLKNDFSFIGKAMPTHLNSRVLVMSSFRNAIISLNISYQNTGKREILSFDYRTFLLKESKNKGSTHKIENIDNRNDESIDALLFIIDFYSDAEFSNLLKNT